MPPEEQQQSAADKLLRAQAAELEALRARTKDLPDPDVLAEWRSKAEQFDALRNDLPRWREELQSQFQAERQELAQQVESQRQQLSQKEQEQRLQTEFLKAGGNPTHFAAWNELYGAKYIKQAEDGSLVSVENGQTMPLSDVLEQQRSDALYGVLYHPRYGSGSGARGGRDGRVATVADLSKMSTSQLFRNAFVKNRQ